jgi:hypothetical protein
VVDEQAELAREQRRRRQSLAPSTMAQVAREEARRAARETMTKLLAKYVAGATDAQVERRFGSGLVQRVLFGGIARAYERGAAAGFQGSLVYELARPATGAGPIRWTIEVLDGRAAARPGGAENAKLTLRFALSDFVRVAAGTIDPAVPLLEDRASFEGDFALVARLPEMFGAPSPY